MNLLFSGFLSTTIKNCSLSDYSTSRPQKYFSHRPWPLRYIKCLHMHKLPLCETMKKKQKKKKSSLKSNFDGLFTETWIYGNCCCLMYLAVHLHVIVNAHSCTKIWVSWKWQHLKRKRKYSRNTELVCLRFKWNWV